MKSLNRLAISLLLAVFVCGGNADAACMKCPGKNAPCAHNDLTQSLDVPPGNWNLYACFSIYGSDDPGVRHDGTEAFIQSNLPNGQNGIIADYALPPGATGSTPRDSTTVARCDLVPVVGPFSFTGTVVTESQSASEWGCPSPKMGIPSELNIAIQAAE